MQFDAVRFRYKDDVPLIEDLSLDVDARPDDRDRRSDRRRQDDARQPADAVLRRRRRQLFASTAWTSVRSSAARCGARSAWCCRTRGSSRGRFARTSPTGASGASDEAIVEAAKAAQADHFIRTLPENYDTPINEEASNLSQGQKQLLTIARAFLADPAILILDEATSSVDTRTEVLIQEAMRRLMRGRTTFVIAHRLSTIRNADVILMMEGGRIVERGTHHELLAAKGRYAALYDSQFAAGAIASASAAP